jgi:hypothetical protein
LLGRAFGRYKESMRVSRHFDDFDSEVTRREHTLVGALPEGTVDEDELADDGELAFDTIPEGWRPAA